MPVFPTDHIAGDAMTQQSSKVNGCYEEGSRPSPTATPNSSSDSDQMLSIVDGAMAHCCTLESSAPSGCRHGSPASVSCLTEDPRELRQKLRDIEAAMLGPDAADDIADSPGSNLRMIKNFAGGGDLRKLLVACAKAVDDEDRPAIHWGIAELRKMVSVTGEPLERVGAYLLEGLIARLARSGNSIYRALKCKEPESEDLLSYMHFLYEACPYFKFGYLSANGAIAEAVKGERSVHIIDFQVAQGGQWVSLLQAMTAIPGGPPSVRLTGIDDALNAHARGGGLEIVGKRLAHVAGLCGVPFEFTGVAKEGWQVEMETLDVREGEAVVVNFPLELHHIPDESVSTANHRDRLVRLVKQLAPKVVTLVEQESNTNTASFPRRFEEAMEYYGAVFESIDVTLPREDGRRISVEQHCLAREIVNIVACEGEERVERHEMFGKWRSRFRMAGFEQVPLSPLVNATIEGLLKRYSPSFGLAVEPGGALFLGWKGRPLVVSCAWR